MKKTDAWMPLYIADYLADTSRLTTEQHGAYLLILMDYWRNGEPPDDDAVLASISRLAPNAWKKARPAISAFFKVADGKWVNKRASEEMAKASSISDKRKSAGKEGASKRWGKDDGENIANGIANAIANGMENDKQDASQIDTPSPSPKDTEPNGSGASTETDAPKRAELIPYQAIIDGYNETMLRLAKVRDLTPKRRTLIRMAWQQNRERQSVEFWRAYWQSCEDDSFSNGNGPYAGQHVNWRPSFDYLIRNDTVTKLVEKELSHAA